MKTFITSFTILTASLSLAQNKIIIDLTEKQAYERFKNSNVRKALNIKLSDFKEHYQYILKNHYTKKLSDTSILNNSENKELLEHMNFLYERYQLNLELSAAGYEERAFFTGCEDCNDVLYKSLLENFKEYKKLF